MSPQNILDSINPEKSFLIHARATFTYYNFSQLCQLSPSPFPLSLLTFHFHFHFHLKRVFLSILALHSLIITFHNCANSPLLLLNHNFPVLSRAGIERKRIFFSLPSISHLFVLQKGGISSLEFVEEAKMQKPKFAKAAVLLPNLKMGFINLDCLGNIVDWYSCHPQERLT